MKPPEGSPAINRSETPSKVIDRIAEQVKFGRIQPDKLITDADFLLQTAGEAGREKVKPFLQEAVRRAPEGVIQVALINRLTVLYTKDKQTRREGDAIRRYIQLGEDLGVTGKPEGQEYINALKEKYPELNVEGPKNAEEFITTAYKERKLRDQRYYFDNDDPSYIEKTIEIERLDKLLDEAYKQHPEWDEAYRERREIPCYLQNDAWDAQNLSDFAAVLEKTDGLVDADTGRLWSVDDLKAIIAHAVRVPTSASVDSLPKIEGLKEKIGELIVKESEERYRAARDASFAREQSDSTPQPLQEQTAAEIIAAARLGFDSVTEEEAQNFIKDDEAERSEMERSKVVPEVAVVQAKPTTKNPEQERPIVAGEYVWRAKDGDFPVRVTGSLGIAPDGREYVTIEGSKSGVPRDELGQQPAIVKSPDTVDEILAEMEALNAQAGKRAADAVTSQEAASSAEKQTKDYYEMYRSDSPVEQAKRFRRNWENGRIRVPAGLEKFQVGQQEYQNLEYQGGGKYCDAYIALGSQGEYVIMKVANEYLDASEKSDFESEKLTLTRLAHYQETHDLLVGGYPVTPQFLGEGRTQDGKEFFAMTVADGVPLISMVFGSSSDNQPILPRHESITVMSQVCRALEALHEGLDKSYFDYQINNIFWNRESGRATVIDWNMLAPRILGNGKSVPKNVESDIFKTALFLYRVAVGRYPDSDARALFDIADRLKDKEISIELEKLGSEVAQVKDENLKGVFVKAFNPERSKRYQSIKELRVDLDKLLTSS